MIITNLPTPISPFRLHVPNPCMPGSRGLVWCKHRGMEDLMSMQEIRIMHGYVWLCMAFLKLFPSSNIERSRPKHLESISKALHISSAWILLGGALYCVRVTLGHMFWIDCDMKSGPSYSN
ncbi:hypothetical protein VNO77_23211 [Canavalia gladiata]|uniref:Uncharacterized protein n=1 Tax=Canavalia gladiata TaxID=3824 RepID=A0AAN9L5H7_CANGL